MDAKNKDRPMQPITRPEIAGLISRSGRTVDRWVERGILPQPTISNGKIAVWDRGAVDAALRGGRQ